MKFEKLSDVERSEWQELEAAEYAPEIAHGMSEDDFDRYQMILGLALIERFEWLLDYVMHNSVDIERLRGNSEFMAKLRRAYEHGVACGNAGCCCNLANLYHDTTNNGSPEDYAIAIELYSRGAALGDDQASVNLGYIYYYGRGVEVDYGKAYECFSQAALSSNHPEGYFKLGDLYAGGKGVRQSDWMAWIMYSKAYELGKETVFECRAAHHVADCLMKGIEGKLEKDPEQAFRLYVKAELGYYDAIDAGLTYYEKCLEQAIEGQKAAREAVREFHRKIRAGESE